MTVFDDMTPNAKQHRLDQATERGEEYLALLIDALNNVQKFDQLLAKGVPDIESIAVTAQNISTLEGRTITLYIALETLKPVGAKLT